MPAKGWILTPPETANAAVDVSAIEDRSDVNDGNEEGAENDEDDKNGKGGENEGEDEIEEAGEIEEDEEEYDPAIGDIVCLYY